MESALLFVACSIVVKVCSLASCQGHSIGNILTMTVYFKQKCSHVTAYEAAEL